MQLAPVEDSDGLVYGVTSRGGSDNAGTLFALNLDGGNYRILHQFRNGSGEAQHPGAGLVQANVGVLYGSTIDGGDSDWGTLFRFDLAPVLYNPRWNVSLFTFQFNARSNVLYQPQFNTSLVDSNWTALPNVTGQGGVVTVTDQNLDAGPLFYRVVIP
jgi:uncharacterized repeat protein (TIGR03803 family)